MGIKHLNRFFRNECKDSIKFINLSELSGKKVAIDISIYMYKYAADNSLIENIYLMLSVFRHYNIIPIFVFDGKPPTEKKTLLQKRRDDKLKAQNEYNFLKQKLCDDTTMDEHDKQEITNNMDLLKRNFIHISREQIKDVKCLMQSYGATYYDAPGEADELCALLAIKNKVWACLSEDMDMFVYGCPRVIRYLSLLNHTVVLYELKKILDNLGINQQQLREICILSGTDYNTPDEALDYKEQPSLFKTLKLFKKFLKATKINDSIRNDSIRNDSIRNDSILQTNNKFDFYDWLIQNTNYIKDYDLLKTIYSMFDLTTYDVESLAAFVNIKISNSSICKCEIKRILQDDGFIFPIDY